MLKLIKDGVMSAAYGDEVEKNLEKHGIEYKTVCESLDVYKGLTMSSIIQGISGGTDYTVLSYDRPSTGVHTLVAYTVIAGGDCMDIEYFMFESDSPDYDLEEISKIIRKEHTEESQC